MLSSLHVVLPSENEFITGGVGGLKGRERERMRAVDRDRVRGRGPYKGSFVCLFGLIHYVLVNNFSVMSGCVFLG